MKERERHQADLVPKGDREDFERLEQEAYGVSSEAMLGTTSVGRSPRLLRPPNPMRETRALVGKEVLTAKDTMAGTLLVMSANFSR